MKIGIYNRYWNTCGGGENYTGSVAEILSMDHEVELISVEPVDWDRIQSRLQLDLSRCLTQQWPNDTCAQLSFLSAQYDLFINSTYSSTITPRSEKSALICYFPHRIDCLAVLRIQATQWVKRVVTEGPRGLLKMRHMQEDSFSPIAGIFPVEPDGRAWVGSRATLAIPQKRAMTLQIPIWPGAYNGIQTITAGNSIIPWRLENDVLHIDLSHTSPGLESISFICKTMSPIDHGSLSDSRHLGVCIDTRILPWLNHSKRQFHFPGKETPRASLKAYNKIISISQFTTEWIGKRWNLASTELQPPIDVNLFHTNASFAKEKIILTVGRFFAGGHNKKHHEIAKAFIQMRQEDHIPSDWRLVFIGARHCDHKIHVEYFDQLQELCAGHPIDIMPDLPFSDLLRYYRRASIYWHGAGWGECVEKSPENFEHFGITTCEAMACECVPIVFDAAGQREIVASNELGFRYSDYEMLAQQMAMLTTATPQTLREIGMKARNSIKRFSRSDFGSRVREAFRGLAY